MEIGIDGRYFTNNNGTKQPSGMGISYPLLP